MPTKQLNHFIPRLMLKYWEKPVTENRYGISVYEIKKARYIIGETRGKKAYSFAIVKNLYVPVINEKRRIEMEDWFGGLEGTLATAISCFLKEDFPDFPRVQDNSKFLMAIFSFKYRTRTFVEHVNEFLMKNSEIKKHHDAEKSIQLITLENIINATRNDVKAYSGCDIEIFKSSDLNFIISDSPFLDKIIDGVSILVLSNKLLLSVRKNDLNIVKFKITPCTTGFVYATNTLIAETAQYWIAGDSQEFLDNFRGAANTEYKVTITYEPVGQLITGFYFNN